LAVSPAVLIPRPDTETAVVEFLERMKGREAPRAVDVGTGSGCIALACVHRHKTARFFATDCSAAALAVAAANAEGAGPADRVTFRRGTSWRRSPPTARSTRSCRTRRTSRRPSSRRWSPGVRDYEPHPALDGGPDGLRVVSRLIAAAVPLLQPGGHLILEIGTDQEAPVRALIAAEPGAGAGPDDPRLRQSSPRRPRHAPALIAPRWRAGAL
jgi:release factor glutamine methyltransferase